MTPAEQMIKRLQAERNFPKPAPMKFPKAAPCDKQCGECERIYKNTTAEYCPRCDANTLWPIAEGVKA